MEKCPKTHPTRALVVEALRAVRAGEYRAAQEAIQSARAASSRARPPSMQLTGDLLRLGQKHYEANRDGEPMDGVILDLRTMIRVEK